MVAADIMERRDVHRRHSMCGTDPPPRSGTARAVQRAPSLVRRVIAALISMCDDAGGASHSAGRRTDDSTLGWSLGQFFAENPIPPSAGRGECRGASDFALLISSSHKPFLYLMQSMVVTPFKTPPPKAKKARKPCICYWGDTCRKWTKILKKKGHPWGEFVKLTVSDSCEFENSWRAISTLIKPSAEETEKIFDKHNSAKNNTVTPPGGKTKKSVSRFKIARHHFALGFFQGENQLGNWVTPMTREQVIEKNCYPDRNLSNDTVIQFDPDLGKGMGERWRKDNPNQMFIKAPTVPSKEVASVISDLTAEAVESEEGEMDEVEDSAGKGNISSATSSATSNATSSIRRKKLMRKLEQTREEEQEEEERNRSPEQWKEILKRQKADHETKMEELLKQIAERDEAIKAAEEQLRKAKHRKDSYRMKAKRAKSSVDEEEILESIALGSKVMWNNVRDLLSDAGGLSRLTIFNKQWHEKHDTAAKLLWGYRSYYEAKRYVKAYFPGEVDVADDPSAMVGETDDGDLKMPPLTPFEQCMICRMFFHIFSHQQIIALCFDRHRTRIGQVLKKWAPKWANIGENLACLDIDENYLWKEVPNKNIELGRPNLVFVDGKDWLIAPKGNDNTVAKCTYSSKTEKDSTRGLTWSTAGGLIFERSPLVGGRAGERNLVKFLGSLGPMNAPLEDWEDIATRDRWTPKDDTYWTALTDVLSAEEFEEVLQRIEDGGNLVSNGALDDGVLVTGQPTGLAHEGLSANNDGNNSSDDEEEEVTPETAKQSESARVVFGIADALDAYDKMCKMKAVGKAQKEAGKTKRPPVLEPAYLEEQNQKALRNDPNSSGKRKLRQLELHERLHHLYEDGKLHKCLLSYFLLVTEERRLKMLSWMGSEMAKHIEKPTIDELPKIPLRLAKIPENYGVGGDKGFSGIERDLPNLNDVDTPPQVANSKTHRISEEMIIAEIPITTVRAPCETVFFRVDLEAVLHEKIPYWIIPFLPHGHALAHGEANLRMPLRRPGRNSIVGDDYWDNVKDYTRIPQPARETRSVVTSARRPCRHCEEGGIVEQCTKCKKWYCFNDRCHDFENCNPGPVPNPYN